MKRTAYCWQSEGWSASKQRRIASKYRLSRNAPCFTAFFAFASIPLMSKQACHVPLLLLYCLLISLNSQVDRIQRGGTLLSPPAADAAPGHYFHYGSVGLGKVDFRRPAVLLRLHRRKKTVCSVNACSALSARSAARFHPKIAAVMACRLRIVRLSARIPFDDSVQYGLSPALRNGFRL
jgi:hypothetical protein